MGGDMPPRLPPGVVGDEVAEAMGPATRYGDDVAQGAGVAQLAGGDAEKCNQVVGFPEAVNVGLTEAGATAQDTAPSGWIVDRDRSA
jgi:hypothetical protein